MNWVKGFDRIALLLAIPIAVLGFCYSSKKYAEKKSVGVYLTEEEKNVLFTPASGKEDFFDMLSRDCPFGLPELGGVIASGKTELNETPDKRVQFALERAYKAGGDREGTLVNKSTFFRIKDKREKYKVNEDGVHEDLCLIPRKSKCYSAGVCGAIAFAILTVIFIGAFTRFAPRVFKLSCRAFKWIFDWVKNGFREKEKTL